MKSPRVISDPEIAGEFDVLLTADKGMEYQQNLDRCR